jgi:inner membrane protein
MALDFFGAALIVIGLVLFGVELIHPGALLLVPGSIVLMAGILYIFFPATLLQTPYGALAILLAAIVGALVQIPFYRWVAPNHRPMTTTSGGFNGEVGVVVSPIVPNTLRGKVRIRTEVWSAQSDTAIPAGAHVKVVSGEGVSLRVVPMEEAPA